MDDLVVELLSMPSPMANRISYLGQPERFRQLKNQIRLWGLEVQRLDPTAEFRMILSALDVPAETLNRIDTRRLQEQLARRRSA